MSKLMTACILLLPSSTAFGYAAKCDLMDANEKVIPMSVESVILVVTVAPSAKEWWNYVVHHERCYMEECYTKWKSYPYPNKENDATNVGGIYKWEETYNWNGNEINSRLSWPILTEVHWRASGPVSFKWRCALITGETQ